MAAAATSLKSILLALDSSNGTATTPRPNRSPWSRALEYQAIRRGKRIERVRIVDGALRRTRVPMNLTKRRRVVRPVNCIKTGVRALRELIPDDGGSTGGVETLLRETADYIACLQMQVKVMRVMVNVLSNSKE